jgi:uncharacterized membrane protein YcaP (DUF421 family)
MNEGLIVLVRGIIGFFTLLIFARLLGKQQISQLTYFDYVVGITIGSSAATLTTDLTSRAWPHWVGLLVWTLACLALQWISLKSRSISKYLDGEPTIVIMNGKIMEDSMRKLRYTLGELLEQLRDKGVFDLQEVAFAIWERNGNLSVLKKTEFQPATPKDLNIKTTSSNIGIEVIYDGVIIDQNLAMINKDRNWLKSQLKKRGLHDSSEIFVAIFKPPKNLYIDLYKDNIKQS